MNKPAIVNPEMTVESLTPKTELELELCSLEQLVSPLAWTHIRESYTVDPMTGEFLALPLYEAQWEDDFGSVWVTAYGDWGYIPENELFVLIRALDAIHNKFVGRYLPGNFTLQYKLSKVIVRIDVMYYEDFQYLHSCMDIFKYLKDGCLQYFESEEDNWSTPIVYGRPIIKEDATHFETTLDEVYEWCFPCYHCD